MFVLEGKRGTTVLKAIFINQKVFWEVNEPIYNIGVKCMLKDKDCYFVDNMSQHIVEVIDYPAGFIQKFTGTVLHTLYSKLVCKTIVHFNGEEMSCKRCKNAHYENFQKVKKTKRKVRAMKSGITNDKILLIESYWTGLVNVCKHMFSLSATLQAIN